MNLFTNAAVVPAKEATAKKSKAASHEIEGFGMYGKLIAAGKAIEGLVATYRTIIEPQIIDVFVADGVKHKKRPENFKGKEGDVTGSCELRKRSSASALSPAEKEICDKHNIKTEVVQDRPETFIVNPEYANDMKLLAAVSDAVSKIKGFPTDFFLKQEATKKTVITEEGLDSIFTKEADEIRILMSIAGTLAVKPKVADFDTVEVLEEIKTMISETEKEEDEE